LDGPLPDFRATLAIEMTELPPGLDAHETALAVLPPEHRHDVPQRLARGDRCWATRHGTELVHALWIGLGSTYSYELDRRFPLETTDATFYGAYTVPAYRSRGIDSAVAAHIIVLLRERGMRRCILLIDPHNPAALRVPEKFGFRIVGHTGFVEVFGLRWYFHRDGGFLPRVQPRTYWRKV
jgi:ribosomal protein S18 acetylase RimI-like enzyme